MADEKQKLTGETQPSSYTESPTEGYTPKDKPPDFLWLSVITLACCCWPISILALIKSIDVRTQFYSGRMSEARIASKQAKKYNIASIVGSLLFIFIVNVIVFVALTPVWIEIARGNSSSNSTDDGDNNSTLDFLFN